jgi:FdhD protein
MGTPVTAASILRVDAGTSSAAEDILVAEEPLEIRLGYGPEEDRRETRLSVTMRTPGNDEELALGFLFTEGIISDRSQALRVAYCESVKDEERGNVVRVELRPDIDIDPSKWQRNFYSTSSCGVCGKSSIESVHTQCSVAMGKAPQLDAALITALPDRMRQAQTVFKHTGGIHAAALFSAKGELLILREDIGRHNAVDKVVGALIQQDRSTDGTILLVSGRAGFELVQKCAMAGIPVMAAVGAPSSLAVQLARESGLTLIGFLRGDRYNVYTAITTP